MEQETVIAEYLVSCRDAFDLLFQGPVILLCYLLPKE